MAPATRYAKTRVASTPAPSKRRPAAVETAEPEQRASRSRVTRDGKFTSLEMNGYGRGNRPVRAVVNAATVKRILGLDLRTSGDRAIRAFRGTNEYAVGSKHSRRREDGAAAPQNLRTRSVVPLKVVENFFKSSGGVDGLEARLLETLFVPHCDRSEGVLTAYDDGTLRPHGLYKKEDYRLIGALTFVDPPGSPAQHNHEDIAGCDRDAIWNVVFPLKLDRPAQIAATEFQRDGGKSMDEGEATLWDAGWLHRGLGNATSTERVFLHLVVAPYWMVVPDARKRDFRGLPKKKRELLEDMDTSENENPWMMLDELQYGDSHRHGMSQEYNDEIPLHARNSPLAEWIARMKKRRPTVAKTTPKKKR